MGLSGTRMQATLSPRGYCFRLLRSWGSNQSGSNWGWGWSSDNSGGGSGSGGSDSNSGGSSWGWGWSSNGTDTNWGWGSSSGSNHSSGTGSMHNGHSSSSNHSSGIGSSHDSHSSGSTHNHTTAISPRRKIDVSVWKSGFDYAEWVSKNAPFYVNDVLIFKYNNNDQTSETKHISNNNIKNNVYLLSDLRSYKRCDVASIKKLVARGGSSSGGFKLLLRKTQPYYFASGDHSGCNHNMKFSLSPIPGPSSH